MSEVCPWWLCFTFDNPVRKLLHDPRQILAEYVQPGSTALDVGCGMGFFSIPLARLVGPAGRVVAADLQPEMLSALQRRAARAGVAERITLHHASPAGIGFPGPVDFALAFWMLHEVGDKAAFLAELRRIVRPGGHFLLVEPVLHVSQALFDQEVTLAEQAGFQMQQQVRVRISKAVLFQ